MRLDIKIIRVEFVRPDTGEVITVDLGQNLTIRRATDEFGVPAELSEQELRRIQRRVASRIRDAYRGIQDSE